MALSMLCPPQAAFSPSEPAGICVPLQLCSGRGQPHWGRCPTRTWMSGTWRRWRSTGASRATSDKRSGRAGNHTGGTPTTNTPTPLQVPLWAAALGSTGLSPNQPCEVLWHRLRPFPCTSLQSAGVSREKGWQFSRRREAGPAKRYRAKKGFLGAPVVTESRQGVLVHCRGWKWMVFNGPPNPNPSVILISGSLCLTLSHVSQGFVFRWFGYSHFTSSVFTPP